MAAVHGVSAADAERYPLLNRRSSQANGTVNANVTANSTVGEPVKIGQRSTDTIAISIIMTCTRKIS